MDLKQIWRLMGLLVCVTVVGAGCGGDRNNGGNGVDDDLIGPDVIDPYEARVRMDERFEEDGRIYDVEFSSVQFGYDQYRIDPSEAPKIERVADYMRQNRSVRAITEGHCDERGSREYNMALGEHRAQAVRAYLISLGVDGSRLQTRSYGEEQPLEPGHNESAWRLNRRVEFALYR